MSSPTICGDCKFWKQSQEESLEDFGACRRNPPAVFEDTVHHGTYSAWPDTHRSAWCGEFRRYLKGEHYRD